MEERGLSLEELLEKVDRDSLPIILLDWNIIKGMKDKGYQGHFVPIVGHDNDNIYVHNHGLDNPTPFLSVKRDVFEEARKANGTDEDIIIIHSK
jgi:hypothetical protein